MINGKLRRRREGSKRTNRGRRFTKEKSKAGKSKIDEQRQDKCVKVETTLRRFGGGEEGWVDVGRGKVEHGR